MSHIIVYHVMKVVHLDSALLIQNMTVITPMQLCFAMEDAHHNL